MTARCAQYISAVKIVAHKSADDCAMITFTLFTIWSVCLHSSPLLPINKYVKAKLELRNPNHKFLTLTLGLGVGGRPLGYKEWRCWANCPCSLFPGCPTYVIPITSAADDIRSQYRATTLATGCTSTVWRLSTGIYITEYRLNGR